jgi:hypothetical protein
VVAALGDHPVAGLMRDVNSQPVGTKV